MSKAYSAVDEVPGAVGFDRTALMLDEPLVFQQRQWEGWEPTGTGSDVAEALGLRLYRQDGGYAGQLTTRPGEMREGMPYTGLWLQQPTGWSRFTGGTYFSENGRLLTLNAAGKIVMEDKPETGTTGRTQFPSERDLDIAQAERLRAQIAQDEADLAENRRQFDIAQANDDRRLMQQLQAQIDLEEMRIENSQRELVYSMGMQERGTLIQEKGETERELMRLGPDPFKQWSHLGGSLQRGTTPQQAVVGQAQAFMQQPLPEVSMDMDVAQLEQALSQMQGQGMQQPQFGTGFGLAQGGTIQMERGGDGAFSMKPKMSYLVGEGKHGEGLTAGTAEILTIGGGKVEVTPFGGGAQGGMEFGLDQLAPLYTDFGDLFGRVPRAKYGPTGLLSQHDTGASSFLRPEAFSAMGITPQLIQFGDSPTVYYRNPATKQYQGIASADVFKKSGFNRSDVIQFNPSAKGAFDLHTGFTEPLPAGGIGMERGGFGATATPLVEASTGAMLPAIHKIVRQLAQWRAEGDYRYDMAVMAYGNALDPATGLPTGGISRQYIDSIVDAATPQAGAFGGRRIGFTGGFM